MHVLANWIVSALALLIVSRLVPGIHVDGLWSALVAAVVIGLFNALFKPILLLLTLPLTIITLGIFTFVINAVLLITASIFVPGFSVNGFGAAFIGSIVLTIVNTLLHWLIQSS